MDTIDEVGIFETNIQLEKYAENQKLMYEISKFIPVSSTISAAKLLKRKVENIISLQKENLMLLSNEISVLEELLKYKECFKNIIVVLSGNLNKEQKENIIKNSPNIKVIKYVNELEYPTIIKPKDSAIILFGYKIRNKYMLTKKSYRTMEIYKDFLGEKIFISCSENSINERPKEWISVNGEKYFTKVF